MASALSFHFVLLAVCCGHYNKGCYKLFFFDYFGIKGLILFENQLNMEYFQARIQDFVLGGSADTWFRGGARRRSDVTMSAYIVVGAILGEVGARRARPRLDPRLLTMKFSFLQHCTC